MKALGIAFSARKEGNCVKCVGYCLENLEKKDYKVETLNTYNLNITPCSHCNYECFNKEPSCPIKDDVPEIYKKIFESDILILGIPTYGGHTSGLYRAFEERGQAIFSSEKFEEFLDKAIGFIVIGNITAMGDMALHEILTDFYEAHNRPEAILLSAREYGRNSIKGDLTKVSDVRNRLDRLVEMLIKRRE